MAAGADGIMVEVHPEPDKAISDAKQTISTETFAQMMSVLRQIAPNFQRQVSGKTIADYV
jgi:3-deoxy-7-phosphoheptulonate synthase